MFIARLNTRTVLLQFLHLSDSCGRVNKTVADRKRRPAG